jgi:hypothetical protein
VIPAAPETSHATDLARRFLELCERNGLREHHASLLRSIQSGPYIVGGDDRFRLFDQVVDWGCWVNAGGRPGDEGTQELADAGAFVTEFVGLHKEGSEPAKGKLEADLASALVRGFAPLVHQIRVAAWLRSRRYKVTIADTDPAAPSFDLLAERDTTLVEVECKAVSVEKGRKVKGAVASNLARTCQPALARVLGDGEPVALLIEAEAEFPEDAGSHARTAAACAEAVRERREAASVPGIRVAPLTCDFPDPRVRPGELKIWARDAAGGRNVRVAWMACGDAPVVLVATSRAADRVVRAIERELDEAAGRQLSRSRPGLVTVLLEGVSEAELAMLAQGSALAGATSRVLAKESRRHLRGVLYFADSLADDEAPLGPHGRRLLAFRNPHPSPFDTPDPDDLLGPTRKPTGPEPVAQA